MNAKNIRIRQMAARWFSARSVWTLLAPLSAAILLAGSSAQAADTAESWISASSSYTNSSSWSPAISSPGGITNWPDDFNGVRVDYDVIITNGSDVCLYTNMDVYGTNFIGVLAIGGYTTPGAGSGVSNALIMTGGMLTLTNSAADAFMVGGDNLSASKQLVDTNYFIMTGGIFNSTNTSGGNNWLGQEPAPSIM